MVLQLLEVADAQYLLAGCRILYDEVAETEVAHDCGSQIHRQFLGVLVEECAFHILDSLAVLHLRRLHDNRKIGVVFAQVFGKFDACLRIFGTVFHKRHVGDYSEHVFAEMVVELLGFFIVARKHHLRAPAHSQHLLMLVECFGAENQRLAEKEFV